ncbi:hypothetical protein EV560_10223 [Bosea sp. BK604]|nr:hypothetical protein EV560_10223 [Bosea sp. BK604]
MMDLSSLTVENVAATIGVGIVAAWLAAAKYLKERKAPPQPSAADVVVAGGTIADMGPFRAIAAAQEKTAAVNERIAVALEAIRDLLLECAQDEEKEEEIVRRAEIMAQQMLRELGPKRAPIHRRRKPP